MLFQIQPFLSSFLARTGAGSELEPNKSSPRLVRSVKGGQDWSLPDLYLISREDSRMKRLFTRRKSSTSTSTSTNSNSPSHNSVPGTDHRGESPISPTSSITQATAVAAAAKSSISAWNTAHPIVTDLVPPAAVVQRSQPTCVSPTTSCLSPAAAAAARGLGSDGVNGGSGTGGVGGPSRSLSISTVPIRPSLGTSTSSMSRAATSYGSAADDGHREGLGSEGGHQSNYGPRATQEIVATGSSGSGESEGKLSVG